MENNKTISCCGCVCSDYPCFKECGGGCEANCGKVFWLKYANLDVCPIYDCKKKKGFESCSECDQLPCDLYFNMQDPNMTKEEHEESVRQRVALLKSLIK